MDSHPRNGQSPTPHIICKRACQLRSRSDLTGQQQRHTHRTNTHTHTPGSSRSTTTSRTAPRAARAVGIRPIASQLTHVPSSSTGKPNSALKSNSDLGIAAAHTMAAAPACERPRQRRAHSAAAHNSRGPGGAPRARATAPRARAPPLACLNATLRIVLRTCTDGVAPARTPPPATRAQRPDKAWTARNRVMY